MAIPNGIRGIPKIRRKGINTSRGKIQTHSTLIGQGEPFREKENPMLWTIAVVLFILWLLGLVSSYTIGGFIHILLVLAVIVILVNIIQSRRIT